MKNSFACCYSLKTVNLSNINSRRLKDMSYAFYQCKSLEFINLSNFKYDNNINLSCAFWGCESLKKKNIIIDDNAKTNDNFSILKE